ncbi:hypothetical protein [Paenibacillus donghaensis]|uniref:Uncharacterized protein n=1 Tax=Paenibacillus donghaensis TaxID=414771 RepID=A0A2Z2KGZ7_9BACL|nr:hypothetical protein [Paenibacillus donghaensis]ASA22503.1 hypothetical protein B9T62_17970 [Paenibacillus donghaensis]
MLKKNIIDPVWARVGFTSPPAVNAGSNIGIVIIDTIRSHPAIRHLGSRLKYIEVDFDLSVTCRDIALEQPDDTLGDYGEHGLMAVLTLSHQPFEAYGVQYNSLIPAAQFIVLNHQAFQEGEGERLQVGMDYILERHPVNPDSTPAAGKYLLPLAERLPECSGASRPARPDSSSFGLGSN